MKTSNGQRRQIAITFPGHIRAVSDNTVVIDVEPINGPVFTEDAMKLTHGLCDADADEVIEDTLDYLQGQIIRRSLRTSRVVPGLEASIG